MGLLKRKRTKSLTIWMVVTIFFWITTDPDLGIYSNLPYGGALLALVTSLVTIVPFLIVFHVARKVLFDYIQADYKELLRRSCKSSVGAGMATISLALMAIAIAMIISASIRTF